MTRHFHRGLPKSFLVFSLPAVIALGVMMDARADQTQIRVVSPSGRNVIVIRAAGDDDPNSDVRFEVERDGRTIIRPSRLGPSLTAGGSLAKGARIVRRQRGQVDEVFQLPWGKAASVTNRCASAVITLATRSDLQWQVELRGYDDGVAFRYRIPRQDALIDFEVVDEVTQFDVAGQPKVLFNTLQNFTTSHESLYQHKALSQIPHGRLIDMPFVLSWEDQQAAAITEARVLDFAGAYLQRPSADSTVIRCRLSPLPDREGVCVVGKTPCESPWRVVLLADRAGELLESNLLQCLNEPPRGDFNWLRAGKTTWHWWYGAFEDDHKLPQPSDAHFQRHQEYIDFCARNGIAYHAVSGDGRAWYRQSKTDYGRPAPDADVLTPRPEIELPRILAYARERGVGIRLWVHWKPLSEQLEEALTRYQAWGVKGLMVDFLDRDDQEMIEFTQRLLEGAARHKLHIQLHGCAKFSGERRTYPHLFNREGVLNLEYLKWSNLCTPDHNVNVAYTRALAGPVDYHLGGFRSVSRAEFQPRDRAPLVMGTRCHHLALYVIYDNPMPMVADAPRAYEGQPGFDFITEVPTVWDETRFVSGEIGDFVVIARRKADAWYVGGITNGAPRELQVPLGFLSAGTYEARIYADGSTGSSRPNEIGRQQRRVNKETRLPVTMAPGGGFVAVLKAL